MTNSIFPELPDQAIVLAAGFGKRLQPITLSRPKPLVRVAGRTLIDRTLDRLESAGVTRAVVNVHYKAEMLEQHLAERASPQIFISHEAELLDTRGGALNALDHFENRPFVAINSDMIWRDGYSNTLQRLGQMFDPERMDALLVLQPTVNAVGYRGTGDFDMSGSGRLTRRRRGRLAPFLFAGIQILNPGAFADMQVEPFSLNRIYDNAIKAGRLFGLRHDGDWIDVGNLAGLAQAETLLKRG